MYVAQLTITPKSVSNGADEEIYDAVVGYCGTMQNHGQTYGEEIIAWVRNRIQITFKLAGPKAHAIKHHSKYGRSELRKLRRLCRTEPKWTMISNAAKQRRLVPDWRKESALYLLTHWLDDTSPVCAGSTGLAVPTCLLPLDDDRIADINRWAFYYRAHDTVWMGSAALEIPAYMQTADPDSTLSERGREICREIERGTRLPTYYSLQRYYGRRDQAQELNRKCPGCGRSWAQQGETSLKWGIADFEFRCDRCRLISRAASDDSDERHARIGEWKPKTRRKNLGATGSRPVKRSQAKPGSKKRHAGGPSLEELLKGITPDNRHEAIDSGPPQGKEIW